MSLDLEKQLTFYGAYHHDSVNKIIHMICVPPILIFAFTLASNSGPLVTVPSWLHLPYLDLNLGTLGALVWGALYVLLEPVAGTALALLCLAGTAGGNYLRHQNPAATNGVAAAGEVLCWVLQFLGHGRFERRAPALLDNLFQAIFLAPLFVWLELLFALGYRQELRARVNRAVQREIAKFRAEKDGKGKGAKAQ